MGYRAAAMTNEKAQVPGNSSSEPMSVLERGRHRCSRAVRNNVLIYKLSISTEVLGTRGVLDLRFFQIVEYLHVHNEIFYYWF
jgi:hypothetical protein